MVEESDARLRMLSRERVHSAFIRVEEALSEFRIPTPKGPISLTKYVRSHSPDPRMQVPDVYYQLKAIRKFFHTDDLLIAAFSHLSRDERETFHANLAKLIEARGDIISHFLCDRPLTPGLTGNFIGHAIVVLKGLRARAGLLTDLSVMLNEEEFWRRHSGAAGNHLMDASDRMLNQPLVASRITDPADDDLFEMWMLAARRFAPEVLDPLSEAQEVMADNELRLKVANGDDRFDFIVLVLKEGAEVVGYASAVYLLERRMIFVGYIGVDRSSAAARDYGTRILIDKLLRECDQQAWPWRVLVAEVEETKDGKQDHGLALYYLFAKHARTFSSDPRGRLYLVRANYRQPALRVDDIEKTPEEVTPFVQRLIYFSRDGAGISQIGKERFVLSPAESQNLFDGLLLGGYAAVNPEAKYATHIKEIHAEAIEQIGSGLVLTVE